MASEGVESNQAKLCRQRKCTVTIGLCRVCSDQARYIHYGGLVCSSCKTFFRRTASYTKNPLRCSFNQNCVITPKTRRNCMTCRFKKCLSMGMSSDLIRKEDLSGMYRSKRKTISKPPALIPSLDLLHTDRSSLSAFNWTSLSNVVHAFDNFIPIAQTRQTIECLSLKISSSPLDLTNILSMFANFYTSAESFIGSSADFQILTLDEKSSLYQRNLHGVLHLCATLILRLSGMFDCSGNDHILISIYGHEIFRQTKRIALQLDCDLTIIKLFLFILSFSSNCYMVDVHKGMHNDRFLQGTFRLFASQNVYMEILWKYMVYRYDYYDASLRFARLIKHMLDFMNMSPTAQQTSEVHQNFVEEISVLTEQSLVITENQVIPLWGKTITDSNVVRH